MATAKDTSTFIADWDAAIPADNGVNGKRGFGAPEMRQMKSGLQAQFPNFTGKAMNCTEDELMILDGATVTTAELNTLADVTAGTASASKALVVDGSKDLTLDGGDLTVADLTSTGEATFKETKETVYSSLATTGSVALNPANGTIQEHTGALTGTVTYTDSLESGQSLTLHILNTGSETINWPTMKWVNAEPTSTLGTTYENIVVLWKVDSTLYGLYAGEMNS